MKKNKNVSMEFKVLGDVLVFCHCDKMPEIKQLMTRKGLFWLMVLQISVHHQLALFFGPVVMWCFMMRSCDR